jgi:gas vesicle protein
MPHASELYFCPPGKHFQRVLHPISGSFDLQGATETSMRFLLGFVLGFGVSLLFAPASGEETRHSLKQRAQELIDVPRQKAEQAAEAAKEKAGELGSRVGRQAAESAVQAMEEDVLGKDKTA